MIVRPLRTADARRLRRMYERTSDETRYRRFMVALPRIPERSLAFLTSMGDGDRSVLIARHHGRIVGEARYHRTGPCEAEIAVIVEDAWQGRGIGRAMMRRLADRAHAEGIEAFTGSMLAENNAAHGLLWSVFPQARGRIESGELLFRIPLVEPALRRCA
jgi:GNAT superfamily N-acetyltransferase